MISNAQKKLLHVARRNAGIKEDDYRALLKAEAGVSSSNDLDNTGLDRVLKRFEKLGFNNTAHKAKTRNHQPQATITEDQQQLIRELYAQLGWHEMSRQRGFNKRCCKKSFPQTRSDAIKVTEGLKKMLEREKGKMTNG
jgi:hypothetical protein